MEISNVKTEQLNICNQHLQKIEGADNRGEKQKDKNGVMNFLCNKSLKNVRKYMNFVKNMDSEHK